MHFWAKEKTSNFMINAHKENLFRCVSNFGNNWKSFHPKTNSNFCFNLSQLKICYVSCSSDHKLLPIQNSITRWRHSTVCFDVVRVGRVKWAPIRWVYFWAAERSYRWGGKLLSNVVRGLSRCWCCCHRWAGWAAINPKENRQPAWQGLTIFSWNYILD